MAVVLGVLSSAMFEYWREEINVIRTFYVLNMFKHVKRHTATLRINF